MLFVYFLALLSGTTVAMWSVTINLDPPYRSICDIWILGPCNIMDPPCILSTIAEIQKGQGLGSGYEWLAGLVSRVCIAGLVFRVCKGGLNISGVQLPRDRTPSVTFSNSS